MNYKIGDKVRIMSEKTGSRWNDYGEMDKWLGKTMTIKKIVPFLRETCCKMEEDAGERCGIGWNWFPEMIAEFAREPRHSIYITCADGKTTHAVKKVDGKIVARSKAVRCPSNTFDFAVGANLAYDRLMRHETLEKVQPEQPKQEDKHTYKVGDKVKVVNNTCGHGQKIGDVITLKDSDVLCEENAWHYNENVGYITERDFEPYTEPKQETVKLYCVKDRTNYVGTLTKGRVYEFVNGDGLTYDNGEKSNETGTYERWARDNKESSPHLVPLVSRPAQVGEYACINDNAIGTAGRHMGKVVKITSINDCGNPCFNPDDDPTYDANLTLKEYLVLDGYKPEPEPEKEELEYYSGKVVCIAGSGGFTVGKPYEFKNGVVVDDDGDVRPSNGDQKITSLSDAFLRDWENKFIEFKGE